MKQPLYFLSIGCFLILATIQLWNFRFEIADHPINDFVIDEAFLDQVEEHRKINCSFRTENGRSVLRLERPNPQSGIPSAPVLLSKLDDVRFIYITGEYRWENVTPNKPLGYGARCLLNDKMKNGESIQPSDFYLFHGLDSQNWTPLELVRELTAGVNDARFLFQMMGETGFLEIADFRVYKVIQRPWVPVLASLLVCGWLLWLFALIRKMAKPSILRGLAASTVLVAASWILVFPQTHTLLPPLLSSFHLKIPPPPQETPEEIVSPKKPKPNHEKEATRSDAPTLSAHQTNPSPPDQIAPPNKELPPQEKSKPDAQPAARDTGFIHTTIRSFSHRFFLIHIPVFAGVTMLIFSITGNTKGWPLVIALAILTETIPSFIRFGFDLKDLVDLILNLSGIALALLLWPRIRLYWEKLYFMTKAPNQAREKRRSRF